MELSRGFLILGRRLIERYRLLKNLAQDRDALRRRLDEELLAKVCMQIRCPRGRSLWSGVRLGLNLRDVIREMLCRCS